MLLQNKPAVLLQNSDRYCEDVEVEKKLHLRCILLIISCFKKYHAFLGYPRDRLKGATKSYPQIIISSATKIGKRVTSICILKDIFYDQFIRWYIKITIYASCFIYLS